MVRNYETAELYNRQLSLRSYGLRPWLKMMADRRLNEFVAEKHYERCLLERAFVAFANACRKEIYAREETALRQFRRRLLEKSFGAWVKVRTMCLPQ